MFCTLSNNSSSSSSSSLTQWVLLHSECASCFYLELFAWTYTEELNMSMYHSTHVKINCVLRWTCLYLTKQWFERLYLNGIWLSVHLRMDTKKTCVYKREEQTMYSKHVTWSTWLWREGGGWVTWPLDEHENLDIDCE